MSKFKVTAEALKRAAKTFEQNVAEYEAASNAAKAAADALASQWEGDAQKAFVEEQARTFKWYQEMAKVVRTYAKAMEAAAVAYTAADIAAKAAMKG